MTAVPTKTAPQASLTFHHCAAPSSDLHCHSATTRTDNFENPLTAPSPSPRSTETRFLQARVCIKAKVTSPLCGATQPSENPLPPSSKFRLRSRSGIGQSRIAIAVKARSKGILEGKARTHALRDEHHDVRRGMAVPVGGADQCRQPVPASFLHDHV